MITAIVLIFVVGMILAALQSSVDVKAASEGADARRLVIEQMKDFSPSVMYGGTGQYSGLALDATRKKLAIFRGKNPPQVISFRQLVAVEIERNGDAVQRTNRGSQVLGSAVGGVLLGPVGILMGGVTGSKRTSQSVRELSLRLYTDNLASPIVDVPFFKSAKSVSPDDKTVRFSAAHLDQWYGRFRAIIADHHSSEPGTGEDPGLGNRRFNLSLQSAGLSKLQTIVQLRKLGFDLAEAKRLAENVPGVILHEVSYGEAMDGMLRFCSLDYVTSIEPTE